MNYCMVSKQGKMLEILQEDRKPFEHETKVPLEGYYEVLNEQRYAEAEFDFNLKTWVGVGEPRPIPIPQPSELDYMIDLDYRLLKIEMGM